MSELTQIAESIRNTMEALDEAHRVSAQLRAEVNPTALKTFRVKMTELHERLSSLKMVLDNEEAYAMDELIDALSLAYSDHRAQYRKTPRMSERA